MEQKSVSLKPLSLGVRERKGKQHKGARRGEEEVMVLGGRVVGGTTYSAELLFDKKVQSEPLSRRSLSMR